MVLFGILKKALITKEDRVHGSSIFRCDDYDITKWSERSFDFTKFLPPDDGNDCYEFERVGKEWCMNSSISTIETNYSLSSRRLSSSGSIRNINLHFDFDPGAIRQKKCNVLYNLNHDDSTDGGGDDDAERHFSSQLRPERKFKSQELKKLKKPNLDTEHTAMHYNRDRIERYLEYLCPPTDVRPKTINLRSRKNTRATAIDRRTNQSEMMKLIHTPTTTTTSDQPSTPKFSNTSKRAIQTPTTSIIDRPSTQKKSNMTSSKRVIQTHEKEEHSSFISHLDELFFFDNNDNQVYTQFPDSLYHDGRKERCDSLGSEIKGLQDVHSVSNIKIKVEGSESITKILDDDISNDSDMSLDLSHLNIKETSLIQPPTKEDNYLLSYAPTKEDDRFLSYEPTKFVIDAKSQPSHVNNNVDQDIDLDIHHVISYEPIKSSTVLMNKTLHTKYIGDKDNGRGLSSLPKKFEIVPPYSNHCSDNDDHSATPILHQTSSLTTHSLQVTESFSSSYSSDNPNILVLKTRLQEIRDKIKGNLTDIRIRNDSLFSPSMVSTYEGDAVDKNNMIESNGSSHMPNLMDGIRSEDDISVHLAGHDDHKIRPGIGPDKRASPTGVDEFESDDTSQVKQSLFPTSKVTESGEMGAYIGKSDGIYDSLPNKNTSIMGSDKQSILKLKARLRQIEMKVKSGILCTPHAVKTNRIS